MKKRIISAMLLASMMLSFTACSSDGDKTDTEDTTVTTDLTAFRETQI